MLLISEIRKPGLGFEAALQRTQYPQADLASAPSVQLHKFRAVPPNTIAFRLPCCPTGLQSKEDWPVFSVQALI